MHTFIGESCSLSELLIMQDANAFSFFFNSRQKYISSSELERWLLKTVDICKLYDTVDVILHHSVGKNPRASAALCKICC